MRQKDAAGFGRRALGAALVTLGVGAAGCTGPDASGQIAKARDAYNKARSEFASCHAPYEEKAAELYLLKAEEEAAENDGANAERLAVLSEQRSEAAIKKNNEEKAKGRAKCAPYHEKEG